MSVSSRVDPTKTTAVTRRFTADMLRRFRNLQKLIKRVVVDENAFGIVERERTLAIQKGQFEFKRPAEKVAAFLDWLYEVSFDEILEIKYGTPIRSAARDAWSNIYLDTAYQRGIRQAGEEMRGAGAVVKDSWIRAGFNRPIHADRVGLVHTRAFELLGKVTEDMAQDMSDVLAQGIAEGLNPEEIASTLTNRVEKIGIKRAKMICRTEIIAAHAAAALISYKEAALDGVRIKAEFLSTDDDRRCPECEEKERFYAANPIPIYEADGIIPVHPNCRCTWIPSLEDLEGLILE